MKFKKILSAVLSQLVIFCSASMPAMATVTVTVDNDALASSGYGNRNSNCVYITADSLYNGDARITKSNEHGEYSWCYSNPLTEKSKRNVSIYAYLAYGDFTDSYAKYYVNDGASKYNVQYIGFINQDKAKSGWNLVGTRAIDVGYSTHAEVRSSDNYNQRMGADAIRVTYYN